MLLAALLVSAQAWALGGEISGCDLERVTWSSAIVRSISPHVQDCELHTFVNNVDVLWLNGNEDSFEALLVALSATRHSRIRVLLHSGSTEVATPWGGPIEGTQANGRLTLSGSNGKRRRRLGVVAADLDLWLGAGALDSWALDALPDDVEVVFEGAVPQDPPD